MLNQSWLKFDWYVGLDKKDENCPSDDMFIADAAGATSFMSCNAHGQTSAHFLNINCVIRNALVFLILHLYIFL